MIEYAHDEHAQSLLLFHGTNADFEPSEFRIGMPSKTIPIGGGEPVPVRNCAAFLTPDWVIARTYGRRVLAAELPPSVRIYEPPEFDWRGFENTFRVAIELQKHGYGAIRFREGDAGYETIAVLDPSALIWRGEAVGDLVSQSLDD